LDTLTDTRICGDDLAGSWPQARIHQYQELVKDCYGKFSEGKHFTSKSKMVFTEIIVKRTMSKKPIMSVLHE